MGGKVWSREEESAFWSVIVPSSNKRLLMDRPSAQNPRGWTQLAAMMQNIMGGSARRRYTPLMLYEHFFQNAVLESYSPSARSFVQAYINEELRVTGHKPSERSRNLVRSAPSEMLASRRRAIANRSTSTGSMPRTTLAQLLNQPLEDSTEAAPSANDIAPPSSSNSLLSPELEAEVNNHLSSSMIAGQLPLPPLIGMYQPRYIGNAQYTHAYDQDITMYQQPYEHTRLPPIVADPAMQSEIYAQHQILPPLSTVIGTSTMAAPSSFYPLDMMEWTFPQEPYVTTCGVAAEAESSEVDNAVQATETTNSVDGQNAANNTFDQQFRLDQLADLGTPGYTVQIAQAQWTDVPQLAAPPASPVSPVSQVSPDSPDSPTSPILAGLSTAKAPPAATVTPAPSLPPTPVETHLPYDPAIEKAPELQTSSSEKQAKSSDDHSQESEKGSSTTSGQDDGLFVPQWA
ncbi:hypothetical protein F503_07406 [Ophiostoma piceae UAMH 11346]|uniref:Uncharacterized protein n=1 Tax=Ophiostoma piceae (strain UAMH 11346) TaxID=1262450 RepID=S3D861_OPHP1|nr:hypothetical protein F503_07406 [Ophiostoma piceae UAMH 11346]